MIFHRFDGLVQDHGEYISVETPGNPGYFWGNYLIFNGPPAENDNFRWRERFKARFSGNPQIRHETYNWENPNSAEPRIGEFLKAGFTFGKQLTMAATELTRPKKWNADLEIRCLESSGDWEAALENQVLVHGAEFGCEEYRQYRMRKNDRYQKMIGAELGLWFGAFLKGRLVGDLGLFHGDQFGRFQLVSTHPDYRRRGVCSTLLYHAGTLALKAMPIKTLVISADDGYFAKDIYALLGFAVREETLGLLKRPD